MRLIRWELPFSAALSLMVFLISFLYVSFLFNFVIGTSSLKNYSAHEDMHQLLTISHQAQPQLTCGGSNDRRQRKEIRDLNPTELLQWRTAMRTLMTQRPKNAPYNPPPSYWDLLVAVHLVQRTQAHNGSYFLPWHRLFLFHLESRVRATLYPDFALPYWDWSQDEDPALSAVWGENYLGGAVTGPAPIPNGPFAGLRGHYRSDHPIRRNFTSNVRNGMSPIMNKQAIDGIVRNHIVFSNFSDAIETAHDFVHSAVGGDMANTATSPNDPFFYLHHTFVDKIWADRQRLHGKFDFGGTHDLVVQGRITPVNVSSDYIFQYFNLPVSVTFDQPCVQYIPYTGSQSSNRAGQGLSRNPLLSSGISMCGSMSMISLQRCRKGEAVLKEAASK